MKKKILLSAAAAVLISAGAVALMRLNSSMDAAEVIRKLQGLRMAMLFFRAAHKGVPPATLEELVKNGNLEAVPVLKLKWHPASSKVRNASDTSVADTGGWGYVNDPGSPDFGSIFIDCSHRDEKGRYWSWF